MQAKFDVGDMIELVPEAFPDDWYEGIGLIMSLEDNQYTVLIFSLVKTSRRQLSTYVLGQTTLRLSIDKADESGYFKMYTT